MKTCPPSFPPRAGFTLVELLVTVAVIGTLAAIAIPVWGNSLAKADEGHCTGNLRQAGMALLTYANDHNMTYPPTGNYFTGHGDVLEALKPYAAGDVNVWYCRRFLKDAPNRQARALYDGGAFGYYYWAFTNGDASKPLSQYSGTSAWTEQGYQMPRSGDVLFSDVFGDQAYWGGRDDVQMHAGSSRYRSLREAGTLVFTTAGAVEKVAPKKP